MREAVVQLEMEFNGLVNQKGMRDLRLIFGVEGSEGYEWRLST